jgi:hypothetical protein
MFWNVDGAVKVMPLACWDSTNWFSTYFHMYCDQFRIWSSAPCSIGVSLGIGSPFIGSVTGFSGRAI